MRINFLCGVVWHLLFNSVLVGWPGSVYAFVNHNKLQQITRNTRKDCNRHQVVKFVRLCYVLGLLNKSIWSYLHCLWKSTKNWIS